MPNDNPSPNPTEAEVVTDFPRPFRPIILPKVAFNSSTTIESPAFWFCFGMVAGFAILYLLKKA